jgi:ribokinase
MVQNTVTVIGSYNVGLFFKGEALPNPGETVIGAKFYEGGGGKGSNQAIAAAMMGANARFIGKIGKDKYGQDAIDLYDRVGVSSELIKIDDTIHSGISVIIVDKDGQNLISVVPGANFKLSKEDIDDTLEEMKDSFVVGFQLENNFDVVEYAIKKIDAQGLKTLLDPAPARELPDDLFPHIHYIKPNEHEASVLTGIQVTDKGSAEKAGHWFLDKGVNTAIITLGEAGSILVSDKQTTHFPAVPVKAIDTTGAGDCFSGALMAALAKGSPIDEAINFASCAAAISVTRLGVVESIPNLEETEAFMKERF